MQSPAPEPKVWDGIKQLASVLERSRKSFLVPEIAGRSDMTAVIQKKQK
jgi:hypothetical protein